MMTQERLTRWHHVHELMLLSVTRITCYLPVNPLVIEHAAQLLQVVLQIERFVQRDLSIIQWVALGAFLVQILSVLLACWLTSVQKAELEAAER